MLVYQRVPILGSKNFNTPWARVPQLILVRRGESVGQVQLPQLPQPGRPSTFGVPSQQAPELPSGYVNSLLWKIHPFLMGKSTTSMVIFNSYVKLPEGIRLKSPIRKLLEMPSNGILCCHGHSTTNERLTQQLSKLCLREKYNLHHDKAQGFHNQRL